MTRARGACAQAALLLFLRLFRAPHAVLGGCGAGDGLAEPAPAVRRLFAAAAAARRLRACLMPLRATDCQVRRCRESGMDGHLPKPLKIHALSAILGVTAP